MSIIALSVSHKDTVVRAVSIQEWKLLAIVSNLITTNIFILVSYVVKYTAPPPHSVMLLTTIAVVTAVTTTAAATAVVEFLVSSPAFFGMRPDFFSRCGETPTVIQCSSRCNAMHAVVMVCQILFYTLLLYRVKNSAIASLHLNWYDVILNHVKGWIRQKAKRPTIYMSA